MDKLISLQKAMELVKDGDTVALGGNVLHRAPMAACRELARQNKKGLKLIKTAGAMDVDILCLAGCAESVDAGFVSYESEFGLASNYRKAVQNGVVAGNEHACYTVISALRAASAGIPFMPVKGLQISDLIEANDYFTRIPDPFSGQMVTVVKALVPDVAIIHVQEADKRGNAIIYGPKFEDVLMTRAAKKVIVTAENIVPDNRFAFSKDKADVPYFMVDAVVHVPKGAAPCDCLGKYGIDRGEITRFRDIKRPEELAAYLADKKEDDYRGKGGGKRAWD